ncbi:MAG: gliding motility lipoprotein GldH [Bacteroidetes bacterium]|nr:gliding motility lipoprotein GldH [Bacteroidota bacterium]
MKLKPTSYIIKLAVVFLLFRLTSCTQINVFEKDTTIPGYNWKSSFEVKGSFTITDTASAYTTYLVLRHTDAYQYNNIWLNVGIQPPADSMHYQKVDMQLGSDATGWMGTGMNDIWEIRQLLFNQAVRFKKPGNYNFTITQIMRDDPLPAVMSAGLRLEKQ